jgi:hypothetical protein
MTYGGQANTTPELREHHMIQTERPSGPSNITVEPFRKYFRTLTRRETDPNRLAIVESTTLGRFVRLVATTDDYRQAYELARQHAEQVDGLVLTASSYRPTVVGEDVARMVKADPDCQPFEQAPLILAIRAELDRQGVTDFNVVIRPADGTAVAYPIAETSTTARQIADALADFKSGHIVHVAEANNVEVQPTSLAQLVRAHLAQRGITAVNVVGRTDNSVIVHPNAGTVTSYGIANALNGFNGDVVHVPSSNSVRVVKAATTQAQGGAW